MVMQRVFVPYGAYFSSPFCRWQGALAGEHALKLAASSAKTALAQRAISPEQFDSLFLGTTVPQKHSFYGAAWVAGLLGAPNITGPVLSQACATSARVLASAAAEIEIGQRNCALTLTCDRTSNGPHIVYPNARGIGGRGDTEDPVWDNFNKDPFANNAMIETAENVARESGISKQEQDEVALLRHEQYAQGLADDRAFQRRYMVPVSLRSGKKTITVDADEGIHPSTADGLARLEPVLDGGTVSFGTQTHPADGHAALVVCTKERADELSSDAKLSIQLLGFGSARVKKGFMPMAVVPAARDALAHAGIELDDCKAIKTHNPFAINDVYFCRETGLGIDKLNRFGSPLVYGHPQAPTGMRAVIELIEELAQDGGGYGLFSGCAAGDTAMALVVKVG